MPQATAELFSILFEEPRLNEFYLIGGTALALHLGHRLSEDLDFIIKDSKLPRARLDSVLQKLQESGRSVERSDSEAAYDDFQNAGMELHDYSQNFVIGGCCKLTFFAADDHHRKLLDSPLRESGPVVASLEELQNLKAIVCAVRSSSRDWLDLYLLAKNHGFGIEGWRKAFKKAGLTSEHFETALKRIRSGRLPRTDPGFKALMVDPPSVADITAFFVHCFPAGSDSP